MTRRFPLFRHLAYQVLMLVAISMVFGGARQFLPNGISWFGKWPSKSTSAEEAYYLMAKPGDPPFISLPEAIELHSKNKAIFLDARSNKEFIEGRIPGARNLPYYSIDDYQFSALDKVEADTPLVVYCEGIGCELSFFLSRDLVAGGYEDVRVFYGGYPEWSEAGMPIEK